MVERSVRDRAGRTVLLTEERVRHIVRRHPILDGHELAITRAVEDADTTCRGNMPDTEVHWRHDLGPAAWLAVVVAYDHQGRGIIRTAFPSRRPPKEENRL
jgi:hypothetical protein